MVRFRIGRWVEGYAVGAQLAVQRLGNGMAGRAAPDQVELAAEFALSEAQPFAESRLGFERRLGDETREFRVGNVYYAYGGQDLFSQV